MSAVSGGEPDTAFRPQQRMTRTAWRPVRKASENHFEQERFEAVSGEERSGLILRREGSDGAHKIVSF